LKEISGNLKEGKGGPEDVEDSQKSQKQQICCEILKMLKNFPKFLGWVFPDGCWPLLVRCQHGAMGCEGVGWYWPDASGGVAMWAGDE
jgi:hypothetical protein